MDKSQAQGYYFEEIVRRLMRQEKFIDVKSQDIPGRGADHQIDSVGFFSFTIPFIYPVRLIAEAKWYKDNRKIGLGSMRDFVGLMKDISENYFVQSTNGRRVRPKLEDRYTDAGAYFSVSGFSSDAQDFAWAHGIYLISFGMNTIFRPLINRAKALIDQDVTQDAKKNDVIEKAQDHFRNDKILSSELSKVYSYIGILDGIYPVMITSDGEFEFNPKQPDKFKVERGNITSNATKEYRREGTDNIHFRFNFQNSNFEFTLPSSTGRYLIDAIENTYKSKPFGYIDIPIELKTEDGNYRRIFRLDLSLPNADRIVRTLKR